MNNYHKIIGKLFLCLLVSTFLFTGCTKPVSIDEPADIPIINKPFEEIVPSRWQNIGNGIQMNDAQFLEVKKELQNAFQKYPPELLSKYLEKVIVFESMNLYGAEYAGTFVNNTAYLTLRDGISYIESVFHHEFNTILLEHHPELFNRFEWISHNPDSFVYWDASRGVEYLKKYGTSQPAFETTYLSDGFLCKYSMTSLDNDLSRYAEGLFTSKKEFWDAFDTFEKVRNKAGTAIEFYNKLNPIFTEKYFRRLGS